MNISNTIAEMIFQMLDEKSEIEFQRNLLAQDLGCVPSQINYVLSSRFTPERGFIVESRRGGGGCIRITRLNYDKDTLIMDVYSRIGDRISENTVEGYLVNLLYQNLISEKEAALIIAATGDRSLKGLPFEYRDSVRAIIFRQMLLALVK